MITDEFAPLELLDLNKPLLPPRSRLYHLEPIGIGTPLVECLTGYIARLAAYHCVHSEMLIDREIMPLKMLAISQNRRNTLNRITKNQTSLNGTGTTAASLVQALETLTLQKNLRFLTMLPWANVFSTRGLYRDHKAWCSLCYHEWHTKGQVIYDPLLWMLQEVLVCPSHKRQLDTDCPSCRQQVPLLSLRSRSGYCSNCGNSLYLTVDTECSSIITLSQNELKQQLYSVQAIGDLLAVSPYFETLPKGGVRQAFREAINFATEGNKAAFSSLLELPKNTVWMWLSTDTLPQLGVVAKICEWLGITIADFLSLKAFCESGRLAVNLLPNPIQRKTKQLPRRINWNNVRIQFLAIVNDGESPPPTLQEAAKRLGINERTLRQHFSDLCHALACKRDAYQRAKTEQMLDNYCELLRRIILDIHCEGQYPTEALVKERIPKPGYFRRKRIRSAFNQAKQELGL